MWAREPLGRVITGEGSSGFQHSNGRCCSPDHSLSLGHADVCIHHSNVRDIQDRAPVSCSRGRILPRCQMWESPLLCHSPCRQSPTCFSCASFGERGSLYTPSKAGFFVFSSCYWNQTCFLCKIPAAEPKCCQGGGAWRDPIPAQHSSEEPLASWGCSFGALPHRVPTFPLPGELCALGVGSCAVNHMWGEHKRLICPSWHERQPLHPPCRNLPSHPPPPLLCLGTMAEEPKGSSTCWSVPTQSRTATQPTGAVSALEIWKSLSRNWVYK